MPFVYDHLFAHKPCVAKRANFCDLHLTPNMAGLSTQMNWSDRERCRVQMHLVLALNGACSFPFLDEMPSSDRYLRWIHLCDIDSDLLEASTSSVHHATPCYVHIHFALINIHLCLLNMQLGLVPVKRSYAGWKSIFSQAVEKLRMLEFNCYPIWGAKRAHDDYLGFKMYGTTSTG